MAKTATVNVKIADREEVKAAIEALTDEVEVLRSVVRILVQQGRVDESRPLPWMIGSPADEAYHRALGNQEEYDRG